MNSEEGSLPCSIVYDYKLVNCCETVVLGISTNNFQRYFCYVLYFFHIVRKKRRYIISTTSIENWRLHYSTSVVKIKECRGLHYAKHLLPNIPTEC
jgi:hypothetical protein